MPISDPVFPRTLSAAYALRCAGERARTAKVSTDMWSTADRDGTLATIERAEEILNRALGEFADVGKAFDDQGAAFDLVSFAVGTKDNFNDLVAPYDTACESFDDEQASEGGPAARGSSWEGDH